MEEFGERGDCLPGLEPVGLGPAIARPLEVSELGLYGGDVSAKIGIAITLNAKISVTNIRKAQSGQDNSGKHQGNRPPEYRRTNLSPVLIRFVNHFSISASLLRGYELCRGA